MTEQQEQPVDPLHGLDPRVRENVEGLIWLGYLEREFEFCGHTFHIRTLKGDEDLAAGLAVKEYVETFSQARAWAWAKVGLSLIAVDGDTTFCPPIGPSKEEFAKARMRYCSSRWQWVLGEYLYAQFVDLDREAIEATKAVQNLSSRGLESFTPLPDFSTELGDLSEETEPTSPPPSTDS